MKCLKCNSEKNSVKKQMCSYKIKDKIIEFESSRRICDSCGEFLYDEDLDNKIVENAFQIYNERYGVLPKKIRELRNSYHLSQELFAKILGCAKKTIVAYENGQSIPNDIYLTVLKSLMNNPELIQFYIDANKDKLTEKEKKKVLCNFPMTEIDEPLNEYNGYTLLNMEKVKQMILKFLQNRPGKTKLLKEMFYADYYYFCDKMCSITGLTYQHQQFGPVPCKYEDILLMLISEGDIEEQFTMSGEYEIQSYIPKTKFNSDVFSKEELHYLDMVEEKFKNYNSTQIKDYSHQEKAWKEIKDFEKIDYNYAFDLKK